MNHASLRHVRRAISILEGQCEVSDWTDITQVTVGTSYTVGLKSDGTVVPVGGVTDLPTWNLRQTL